jgi:hypothetical protein
VHVIEKGTTNGVLKFLTVFDEEKEKCREDSLRLRSF